jgi:NADH-quinone oxidoreductase subunit G
LAIRQADLAIVVTPFFSEAISEYADVVLPAAPFSETSGTFINAEGRVQSFEGACRPLGEARPAWKIFCALGKLLELPGFDYASSAEAREKILPSACVEGLDNGLKNAFTPWEAPWPAPDALQRVSDVPVYFSDSLVRRASALQKTRDAAPPEARMHPKTLERLEISEGDRVTIRQGYANAILKARSDATLPEGSVRVAAAHPLSAGLGDMFGTLLAARA